LEKKIERKLKNYFLNKPFQSKFLLRIFIFTFVIVSISSFLQYYLIAKPVFDRMVNLNIDMLEQQLELKILSSAEEVVNDEEIKDILKKQEKFLEAQSSDLSNFNRKFILNVLSRYWVTFLIGAVILNMIFSFVYGVLLSHNIAGNHYRLEKFAKQLQAKDLATPLIIRRADFFQETAKEMDVARNVLCNDIKDLKENKSYRQILDSYRV